MGAFSLLTTIIAECGTLGEGLEETGSLDIPGKPEVAVFLIPSLHEPRPQVRTGCAGAIPLQARVPTSCIVTLLLVGILTNGPAVSQELKVLSASCVGCVPEAQLVSELRGELVDIPLLFTSVPGHYAMVGMSSPGQLSIFDQSSLAGRVLGRAGTGPGEFSLISGVGANGDTLYAFDRRNRTLTALSLSTGGLIRTVKLNAVPTFAGSTVLHDGRVFVGGVAPSRQGFGYPLHLLGSSGVVLKSFGGDRSVQNISPTAFFSAQLEDGTFVLAEEGEVMLRRYGANGDALSPVNVSTEGETWGPGVGIIAARLDADGFFWAFGL